jgi:signal transduction histidine kinase
MDDMDKDMDGSGLALIQRRAGMFGGSLQIISQPGHGTIATLLLPFRLTRASAPLRHKQKVNSRAQNTDRR